MKNIYKISAILLVSLTVVITSCKKDEQIIEGCTDSSAMNYLSNATSNNGSCIYAYDIALGSWNRFNAILVYFENDQSKLISRDYRIKYFSRAWALILFLYYALSCYIG